MTAFQSLHREIDTLERQVGADTAWRTLCETATALHAERGVCPFCRERGELHRSGSPATDSGAARSVVLGSQVEPR